MDSVRSFQPAAHSSKAGRLEFKRASSEEERDDREVVKAFVVRCKDRKVGYEVCVREVRLEVRWCDCV